MQQTLQQLLQFAQAIGKPIDHPTLATPVALLPDGVKVESLEKLLPQPVRARQTVRIIDATSFIAYVNRFATPATSVFCNGPEGRTFRAVFDYHTPEAPAWMEHSAVYCCPLTVEWGAWSGKDRKPMTQEEFGEFIENNVKDIVTPPDQPGAPTAAEMLEISLTLEAKKNISFRQGTRLDNGQVQLTYHEEIDGRAGATGQLNIPEQFFIGIKPFLGGEGFLITARFRYRIREGRLAMWYELVRPDKVLEEAYNAVRKQIGDSIGTVPVYEANL